MATNVLSNAYYDAGSRTDPSVDIISSFMADWVPSTPKQPALPKNFAKLSLLAVPFAQSSLIEERVRKLGREYQNAKQIRDDIVDLAGVRIALYFPSDREKIVQIIHGAFTVVKRKTFPEQDDKQVSDSMSQVTEPSLDFQQRFSGYSTDHYRVRMRVENLATKKLRDDFQKIDHDLVYKTLTGGPASQQELRLLDATNGLVCTGEVLLQQLQTAMDDRVAYQKKSFSEQYELLSFLRGQIKKVEGSMEHLDVLLLVLKITTLDSPRRLGETLEGFMVPSKSADPIALTILEHILTTLGEEQRRDNNLYLRSRSVVLSDLEIDKKNSKCYTADVETRDKILNQRGILETAFANIRPDRGSKDEDRWLCEMSLKELDPPWTWFETNDDVLFRVSLLLARMNVKDIDEELIKLRSSSGFQRQPSVFELNLGHMNPRIPSAKLFGQSPSRDDEDVESRLHPIRSTPKSSEKSRPTSKSASSQKEQNTTRKRAALVPEHGRNSDIEEEEEEEASAVLAVERTRRPYHGSGSKQGANKGPERHFPSIIPMPGVARRPFGPVKLSWGPSRSMPGTGISEETEHYSAYTREKQNTTKYRRTGQNAHATEDESEDSNEK
ncbi:hypothetical protein B0O99DRAFT_690881 [Bisporella sp. PMI_857]|nr:hypothetical protein B0O99DRAFT_690881 [Bisporella sp. PMI_857]